MMEGYTILSLLLCLSAASAASNYDVRLTGPDNNERMGRVEISWNEQWGTVCDVGWDIEDANVVCKQLGFPDGADPERLYKKFGKGSGTIWVAGMDCTGKEAQLKECHVRNNGAFGCTHDQDVGVSCLGWDSYGKKKERWLLKNDPMTKKMLT
ncbi:galectin-3-binding protein B [Strongylocentrotus purpuratus]|uniref:SRCR domain-containing protein n=1 Tax=Strongylocentrotus purpuratus TaxID=7668 RepID=A0A7M7RD96_STRPU|nr:galectin-3-binding protein B [Strongylocentrotus purpuratus]